MPGVHQVATSLLLQVGGVSCYSNNSSIAFHAVSIYGGKGSSFIGLVPPDDMVVPESVVRVNPGDSSVKNVCNFDNFNCTLSVEHFVSQ